MDRKLGKGIVALIPDSDDKKEKVSTVAIESIVPNKYQPRKRFDESKLHELMESIKEKGIIQPVVVRPMGNGYELIAGERRLRAMKELGLTEVPVLIKDVGDADSLELSLIENIQREELNPIEEATAYKDLMDKFNFTQDSIAKAVGKDKSTVSNTLRLLALPRLIQDYITENMLSSGHAKAILALPTERARIRMAKTVIKRNLSVRQAEEAARKKTRTTARREK
ncbi:MAG: ParB/RepB/Spo0J family partition protein [Candidatus Omnitrophota bacterium]